MNDVYRAENPNRKLRREEARAWAEKARAMLAPKGSKPQRKPTTAPAVEPDDTF